jgi:hypothetical protein
MSLGSAQAVIEDWKPEPAADWTTGGFWGVEERMWGKSLYLGSWSCPSCRKSRFASFAAACQHLQSKTDAPGHPGSEMMESWEPDFTRALNGELFGGREVRQQQAAAATDSGWPSWALPKEAPPGPAPPPPVPEADWTTGGFWGVEKRMKGARSSSSTSSSWSCLACHREFANLSSACQHLWSKTDAPGHPNGPTMKSWEPDFTRASNGEMDLQQKPPAAAAAGRVVPPRPGTPGLPSWEEMDEDDEEDPRPPKVPRTITRDLKTLGQPGFPPIGASLQREGPTIGAALRHRSPPPSAPVESHRPLGPRVSPVEGAQGRTHVLPSDYLKEEVVQDGWKEIAAFLGRFPTPDETQIWALGYGKSHFSPGSP